MTIEEIESYLTENKENEDVKGFRVKIFNENGLELMDTDDGKKIINEYLKTDNGIKLLEPITDRRVSGALKTYSEGRFKEEVQLGVDEQMIKLNPKETEDHKRIRELEKLNQEKDRETKRERMKSFSLTVATDKSLAGFKSVKHLIGDTEEEIRNKMTDFEEDLKFVTQKAENKIRAEQSGLPGAGKAENVKYSMDEIKRMTPEQVAENMEDVQKSLEAQK